MSTMGDPTIPPPPGIPTAGPNGTAPFLQRKVGPVPMPVVLGLCAVGLWFFWKRYRAGAAANAANASGSSTGGYAGLGGTTTLGTTPYGPFPVSASGPFGGGGGDWWSSQGGAPATNNQTSVPADVPAPPLPAQPPIPVEAPQTTGATAAVQPPNPYFVGQQVAPGETIVSSQWDQARGTWLNLTNLGGVYASGGKGIGGTPYGGSYLGYLNSLKNTNRPQYQTEISSDLNGPGLFSKGALQVNPDGSYTLVNNLGQKYGF